jgi:hypothetical protein
LPSRRFGKNTNFKLRDSVAELTLIQVKYKEEARQESLITQVKAERMD